MGAKTHGAGAGGDGIDRRAHGLVVLGSPPVEGQNRPFILQPDLQPPQLRAIGLAAELLNPPGPVLQPRIHHGLGPARAQQFGAMRPQIRDRPDRHHRAGLGGPTAAHTGHEPITPGHRDQNLAGLLRHMGIRGLGDDRGQGAIDVQQDGRARRVVTKRRKRLWQER